MRGATILQFRQRPAKPIERPWDSDLHARFPRLVPDGLDVDCGAGWRDLICDALAALQRETDEHHAPQVTVTSCEQAWGKLSIELAGEFGEAPSPAQSALLHLAGEISLRVCEVCGAPGQVIVRRERSHVRCQAHQTGGVRQSTSRLGGE